MVDLCNSDEVIDLCSSSEEEEEEDGGPASPMSKRTSSVFLCTEAPPKKVLRVGEKVGDDIEVTHEVKGVNMLADFPHTRENCAVHPFTRTSTARETAENHMHCDNCYCYICDDLVKNCSANWLEHCNAHHQCSTWKARRKLARNAKVAAAKEVLRGRQGDSTGGSGSNAAEYSCERATKEIEQIWPEEAPSPPGLAAGTRLKHYQRQSLAFMVSNERARIIPPSETNAAQRPEGTGGWLCDEVGMGKTLVRTPLAHSRYIYHAA